MLVASALSSVILPRFPKIFVAKDTNKCYQKDNKTRDFAKNW